MRHFLSATLSTLLLPLIWCSPLSAQESTTSRAYLVADVQSGHILIESEANVKVPVASLTKVATAMVVLDWAKVTSNDIGQMAVVPPGAQEPGGSSALGLLPGDQMSLRDLLYAALLQSDNTAAYTLAYHVGSKLGGGKSPVGAFVTQMNALAGKLGMKRTQFLNPHGLDAVDKPYSTAADMARLASYAIKDPAFQFYVSQKERKVTVNRAGQLLGGVLQNTNELLGTEDIDGIKTGQTSKAGGCVMLTADRSPEAVTVGTETKVTPRRLVVIVLGSNNRFGLGLGLLRQGWKQYDAWASQGRPLAKGTTL